MVNIEKQFIIFYDYVYMYNYIFIANSVNTLLGYYILSGELFIVCYKKTI